MCKINVLNGSEGGTLTHINTIFTLVGTKIHIFVLSLFLSNFRLIVNVVFTLDFECNCVILN